MPLPRAGRPTARAVESVKASAPLQTAARRPLVVCGGGGAHTNSELPQAGFPESGEVSCYFSQYGQGPRPRPTVAFSVGLGLAHRERTGLGLPAGAHTHVHRTRRTVPGSTLRRRASPLCCQAGSRSSEQARQPGCEGEERHGAGRRCNCNRAVTVTGFVSHEPTKPTKRTYPKGNRTSPNKTLPLPKNTPDQKKYTCQLMPPPPPPPPSPLSRID